VPALGRDCPRGAAHRDVQRFDRREPTRPLPTLVLLRPCPMQSLKLRAAGANVPKPLCVVVQYAGSVLPEGDFDRLSRSIASASVTVLNWINDPLYVKARTSSGWCRARAPRSTGASSLFPPRSSRDRAPDRARAGALFVTRFIAPRPGRSGLPTRRLVRGRHRRLRLTSNRRPVGGRDRDAEPLRAACSGGDADAWPSSAASSG